MPRERAPLLRPRTRCGTQLMHAPCASGTCALPFSPAFMPAVVPACVSVHAQIKQDAPTRRRQILFLCCVCSCYPQYVLSLVFMYFSVVCSHNNTQTNKNARHTSKNAVTIFKKRLSKHTPANCTSFAPDPSVPSAANPAQSG